MDNYILKTFGKILKSNHSDLRTELGRGTDVMRVYERALDSLDCSVDLYGQYALVTFYGDFELTPENMDEVAGAVASNLYISRKNVVFKEKKKGVEFRSVYSEPVPAKVKEEGLTFNVELAMKGDTGFYIDNYRAHLLVREYSGGLSVLNLFSYTGGYSVNAAAGGAERVVSVDTSASANEAAALNMKENGFEGENFEFVRDDCVHYIENCPEKSFDLIVFDAPTFSNAHGGRRDDFDIQRDHAASLLKCRRLLRKNGVILFRTAMQDFSLESEKLSCYKIRTYTAEMRAPGFTRRSRIAKTFVLKPYEDHAHGDFGKRMRLSIQKPADDGMEDDEMGRKFGSTGRDGGRRYGSDGDFRFGRDRRDGGDFRRERRGEAEYGERDRDYGARGGRDSRDDFGSRKDGGEYGDRRESRDGGYGGRRGFGGRDGEYGGRGGTRESRGGGYGDRRGGFGGRDGGRGEGARGGRGDRDFHDGFGGRSDDGGYGGRDRGRDGGRGGDRDGRYGGRRGFGGRGGASGDRRGASGDRRSGGDGFGGRSGGYGDRRESRGGGYGDRRGGFGGRDESHGEDGRGRFRDRAERRDGNVRGEKPFDEREERSERRVFRPSADNAFDGGHKHDAEIQGGAEGGADRFENGGFDGSAGED